MKLLRTLAASFSLYSRFPTPRFQWTEDDFRRCLVFLPCVGLVIGAMGTSGYREYEIQLDPGDKVFVYTDGVPEATDPGNDMFGAERMLAALNVSPDVTPEQHLKAVRRAVDDFMHGAEQFDDLTMLCLEYRGAQPRQSACRADPAHRP